MLGGGLSVRSAVLIVQGRKKCLSKEAAPKAEYVLTAAEIISIVYMNYPASCTHSDVSRVGLCTGYRIPQDLRYMRRINVLGVRLIFTVQERTPSTPPSANSSPVSAGKSSPDYQGLGWGVRILVST